MIFDYIQVQHNVSNRINFSWCFIYTWRLYKQSSSGKQQDYDKFIKFTLGLGFWALVIEILFFEKMAVIWLEIINLFVGAGLGGLYSVLLESLMEKHFPVQELVIGTLLTAVACSVSLVIAMILIIPEFLLYGFQITCYYCCILSKIVFHCFYFKNKKQFHYIVFFNSLKNFSNFSNYSKQQKQNDFINYDNYTSWFLLLRTLQSFTRHRLNDLNQMAEELNLLNLIYSKIKQFSSLFIIIKSRHRNKNQKIRAFSSLSKFSTAPIQKYIFTIFDSHNVISVLNGLIQKI